MKIKIIWKSLWWCYVVFKYFSDFWRDVGACLRLCSLLLCTEIGIIRNPPSRIRGIIKEIDFIVVWEKSQMSKKKCLLFFNASHHLRRRRSSGVNSGCAEAGGPLHNAFHLVPCTDTAGDASYQACQIQKKQFSKHCDQILMKFNSFLALLFLGDIIDKSSLCFPPCSGSLFSLAALSKCFFSPQRWLVFTSKWEELCSLTAYSVNNQSCQDIWILQFSFQESA